MAVKMPIHPFILGETRTSVCGYCMPEVLPILGSQKRCIANNTDFTGRAEKWWLGLEASVFNGKWGEMLYCESAGGKQRVRCVDQLSGTGWNEGEKDRKIQLRCFLTGISCCRRCPVTKMSQWFTVGQTGELCCHHYYQNYGYSLKPWLLVHSGWVNLQGASVGGCICVWMCETAAQQEMVVPLRCSPWGLRLREDRLSWEKSRWWPSRPGWAPAAARGWQQGCPGMVWCGCWLTFPPRQGAAMLPCCLSLSAGHGPLGVPSASCAARPPSCHTGPARPHRDSRCLLGPAPSCSLCSSFIK